MLVRDLMTPSVVTATPNDSIASLVNRMRERNVGAIVLMKGTEAVGIFTRRDLVPAIGDGLDLETEPVADHMTPDPVTVAPDLPATEASALMRSKGIRHLPVVEGNMCIGMITLRDLLTWREQDDTQTELRIMPEGRADRIRR